MKILLICIIGVPISLQLAIWFLKWRVVSERRKMHKIMSELPPEKIMEALRRCENVKGN